MLFDDNINLGVKIGIGAKTIDELHTPVIQTKPQTSDLKYQLIDFKKFPSGIKQEEEDNTLYYQNFLNSLKEDSGNHTTKHQKTSCKNLNIKSGSPWTDKQIKKRNSINLKQHSSSYLLFKPKKVESKFTPIRIENIKTFKLNSNEIIDNNKSANKSNNNLIVDIKSFSNTSNNKVITTPKNSNKESSNNNCLYSPSLHNNSRVLKPTTPKKLDKSLSYHHKNQTNSNKDGIKANFIDHLEASNNLKLSSIHELSKDGNKKSQERKTYFKNNAIFLSSSQDSQTEQKHDNGKHNSKQYYPDRSLQFYSLKVHQKKNAWFKCCIPIN